MEILLLLGGIALIIFVARRLPSGKSFKGELAIDVAPRRIASDDFEIVRREASLLSKRSPPQ